MKTTKQMVRECAENTLKMARISACLAVPCVCAVVIATVAVCHNITERWVTDFIICGSFGTMFFALVALGLTHLAAGDMQDFNNLPDPTNDGEKVQMKKAA